MFARKGVMVIKYKKEREFLLTLPDKWEFIKYYANSSFTKSSYTTPD